MTICYRAWYTDSSEGKKKGHGESQTVKGVATFVSNAYEKHDRPGKCGQRGDNITVNKQVGPSRHTFAFSRRNIREKSTGLLTM